MNAKLDLGEEDPPTHDVGDTRASLHKACVVACLLASTQTVVCWWVVFLSPDQHDESGSFDAGFRFGDSVLDLALLSALQTALVVGLSLWATCGRLAERLVPPSADQQYRCSTVSGAGLSLRDGMDGAAVALLAEDALGQANGDEHDKKHSGKAEVDLERASSCASHGPRASSVPGAELPTREELLKPFLQPVDIPVLGLRVFAAMSLLFVAAKCLCRLITLAGRADDPWFWLVVVCCVVLPTAACSLCCRALRLMVEDWTVLNGWVPPRGAMGVVRSTTQDNASFWDLWQLLRPDLHLVFVAVLGLTVAAAGEALIPFLYGKIIEEVALKNDQNKFHLYMLALVVTAAVTGLFTGVRGSTFIVLGARFSVRLRHLLFTSLLQQEVAFYDSTKTGDISSRLSADCQKVGEQVELNVNVALRSLLQAALTLGFMFFINWKLACLAFVTVPNVVVLSKLFGAFMRKLSKKVQQSLADSTARAEEALGTIRTVKAHHAERELTAEYQTELKQYKLLSEQLAAVYFPFSALTYTFLPYCASCLVLYYGGKLVNHDGLSSGELVSFVFYMQSLFAAFNSIGSVYVALVQAVGAADKVFEWIHRRPELRPAADDGGLTPHAVAGTIELKDVVFRYPTRPERVVLRGLNLVAQPGKVLALVGASGGGKSSVLALIQHWYDCEEGAAFLDGVPVRDLNRQWFHRTVAMVSQEPVLYNRSIFENIVLGLGEGQGEADGEDAPNRPSMEEVTEACRMANAHGFISALPQGYDTNVGERGTKLSGGQRQRLAVARALVRRPKVLLLDEATSALDSESEYQVQEAIDRMIAQGDMTVIIIAHRLSTVKNADAIAVINDGAVVEFGTHSELMGRGGTYKTLVTRQLNQPLDPHAPAPATPRAPQGGNHSTATAAVATAALPQHVRQLSSSSSPGKDYSHLVVGAQIEAKWRGAKWYQATVTAVDPDKHTVDVTYVDGWKERGISRVLTRRARQRGP